MDGEEPLVCVRGGGWSSEGRGRRAREGASRIERGGVGKWRILDQGQDAGGEAPPGGGAGTRAPL